MAGISCKYHPLAILIEDYRAGDQICGECGLVVGDRVIDVSAEWRTFNESNSVDRCRVGSTLNPLLDESDLSSITIGMGGQGSQRSLPDPSRTLRLAFKEIGEMGSKIHLTQPSLIRAHSLFKMIRDQKKLLGRSVEAACAVCLYISCRQEGVPRTFKEICAVSRVSEKTIKRSFKVINNLFKQIMDVDKVNIGDYMPRFCAILQLPPKVQRVATAIERNAHKLDLVEGRAPISVTAAAIFISCKAAGINQTYRSIGQVVGVSETTIRAVSQLLLSRSHDLYPKK